MMMQIKMMPLLILLMPSLYLLWNKSVFSDQSSAFKVGIYNDPVTAFRSRTQI